MTKAMLLKDCKLRNVAEWNVNVDRIFILVLCERFQHSALQLLVETEDFTALLHRDLRHFCSHGTQADSDSLLVDTPWHFEAASALGVFLR